MARRRWAARALTAAVAAVALMTSGAVVADAGVNVSHLDVEVLDPDGRPVAGAVVWTARRTVGFPDEVDSWGPTATGSNGVARLNLSSSKLPISYAVLAPAGSGLGAVARGGGSAFAGAPSRWSFVDDLTINRRESITLPAEVVVEGRLTLRGEPVRDERVTVLPAARLSGLYGRGDTYTLEEIPLPAATTDAEGRYRIHGLAPTRDLTMVVADQSISERYDTYAQFNGGSATVATASRVFAACPDAAETCKVVTQDFALEPGAWIVGQVSDADGPAAGVEIYPEAARLPIGEDEVERDDWPRFDRPRTVITDDDGRYRIGPLVKGARYRMSFAARTPSRGAIFPQDWRGAVRSRWYEPEGLITAVGETTRDVALRYSHILTGRVVDELGLPVAEARVSWDWPSGTLVSVPTRADGTFRIDVPSGVSARLSARARWSPHESFDSYAIDGSAKASLDPVDVGVLVLPTETTLRGSFADELGQPVNALAHLERWNPATLAWERIHRFGWPTENGVFLVGGLHARSRYSVVVEMPEGSGFMPHQRMSVASLDAIRGTYGDGFDLPTPSFAPDGSGRRLPVELAPIVLRRFAGPVSPPATTPAPAPTTVAPRDPAPVFSAAPVVTGTVKVGATLAVRENIVGKGAHARYQWFRNGKAVPRATAAAFKVRKSDVGSRFAVRVTATRGTSTATVRTSGATKVVPKMVPTLSVVRTTRTTSRTVKVRVDVRRTGQTHISGKVRVRIGKASRVATVRHAGGRSYVVVTMPRLARGKHHATVTYTPSTSAGKYYRSVVKRTTIRQR